MSKFQAPYNPASGGSLATGSVLGRQPVRRELGQLVVLANFSSRPQPLGALSPTAPAAPCRGSSATLPSVGCQPSPSWLPWCHLMGILLQALIWVRIRAVICQDLQLPSHLPLGGGPAGDVGKRWGLRSVQSRVQILGTLFLLPCDLGQGADRASALGSPCRECRS